MTHERSSCLCIATHLVLAWPLLLWWVLKAKCMLSNGSNLTTDTTRMRARSRTRASVGRRRAHMPTSRELLHAATSAFTTRWV